MQFPKRIAVVTNPEGCLVAAETIEGIHPDLLWDGAEVGVYLLARVKLVQVTRKLVKIDGTVEGAADDDSQIELPMSASG